ncbi:hypothetical protein PUNSTDRAFT_53381 [Punctularia strigosozonata HHB-11173 SS5]|uniref:uncharacterized protein n=1 Tax=Punctularia strigosozonata (strain HHB-11173) TaxID=741275 RepID=UPI000441631B|nr:uncharacterized protein PUNSTDRAFT_53381 [Punctularia strigosozonata HHB-11173 SS5]EIN08120.1 hypothetical protein PUNSTDRAFT_53381 [Punctularia strigosozonata HHB-11173 SS5]
MVSTPTPPPARTRTPLDWLLRRRKTQVSNDPTPPQIFIEPPSQTVSTISSARTEAHLLTPEHAERPLPAIPSIDEALQAILGDTERPPAPVNADAAIPDLPRPDPTPDQFRDPTNSTVSPLTTANLTSQVDPAIPRVTELPLGFVPVRNETDYFSLKHEPLGSTLERIRADARSPSDRSLREDGPERYAAAPVPPGVVYPDLRGGQRLSPVGEEYLSPNRLNRPISLFSEE